MLPSRIYFVIMRLRMGMNVPILYTFRSTQYTCTQAQAPTSVRFYIADAHKQFHVYFAWFRYHFPPLPISTTHNFNDNANEFFFCATMFSLVVFEIGLFYRWNFWSTLAYYNFTICLFHTHVRTHVWIDKTASTQRKGLST